MSYHLFVLEASLSDNLELPFGKQRPWCLLNELPQVCHLVHYDRTTEAPLLDSFVSSSVPSD